MGRRKYRGQEWANRDLALSGLFVALLWLGAFDVRYFYAALVLLVAFLTWLTVRAVRRRRKWKREGPGEFWADKIK